MQRMSIVLSSEMKVIVREKRNGRRLSPEDVYRMRCAALAGVSHSVLAAVHGVAQSTATRAINGDTHALVPHPVEAPHETERGLDVPRFLSYREALAALASASPGVRDVVVDERPRRRMRASVTLKLLDMVESERAALGSSGRESAARARAEKQSDDRRAYLRRLLADALGSE
jgi:hypothetical protein